MKVQKGIYIALCLFLGSIGAHKFYSGKWVQGFLYLVLCATGISLFLSVFDLLIAIFKRADSQGEIMV